MELLTSPTPNGWKVTIMVEELREAGFELADLTITPIDIMKGDQFTETFTEQQRRELSAAVEILSQELKG